MERGDVIALAAGILIVIVIAVVVKFGGLIPAGQPDTASGTPVPEGAMTGIPATPAVAATTQQGTAVATPVPAPADPVPYRIYYTGKPLSYPAFMLPEHMETFGTSDVVWKNPEIVSFAYIEESRSGLTQVFNVPYGVWGMNVSVEAWTKPQYARFDMVLCNASDGKYIDGIEILGTGTAFGSVQISNRGMYLIIHLENVNRFRINYLTPRTYYTMVA